MNFFYDAIQNQNGDIQVNARAQVLDSSGDILTIYADAGGTRFTDAFGTPVNYCVAGADGMVQFYFEATTGQTLEVLDATGGLLFTVPDFANNFSTPEVTLAALEEAEAFATAAAASKTGAETAETNAETAEANAEAAQSAAETAQTAAELAETNAEIAQAASELAQFLSENARDVAIAAGVQYPTEAAAVAALADGAFGSYLDADGLPVWGQRDGSSMVPIPGPWFDQDKVGEKTVSALIASTETARGVGSLWKAENHRYEEADPSATDHHLTTAGGVKLYVLPGSDNARHTAALGPQAGLEVTTQLNALIASCENGVLVFDYDPLGFLTNSIIFPSTVTVWCHPGTYIGKVTGGIRVFHIASCTDVHIIGYGATLCGNDTGNSHTLYINQSERITVEGLYILGSGTTGDDCIYIGGSPSTGDICRDIVFREVRCEGMATTRSGLVLTAVHGFYAHNCKFSNGGGSMENSNGMDIEPNGWMGRDKDGQAAVQNVWFYNCDFHDSREQGCALGGNNMNFIRCRFYNNGKQGAATSSNPYVVDLAKYRTGDLLGVSAVSTADGWLTVTTGTAGVDLLTDDFGIDAGAVIGLFGVNGGATWPTGLTGRMVIAEIDSTQSKIRIAADYIYDKKTSLSGGSYPVLDTDPAVASLYIWVSTRLGVNSNITMTDCEWYDNCLDGSVNKADLSLSFGYNIKIIRPKIIVNATSVGHDGIVAPYSYKTYIESPDISAADKTAGATSKGITLSIAPKHTVIKPDIRNLGRNGIVATGLTECLIDGGRVTNCGTTLGPPVSLNNGDGGETRSLNVFNNDAHRSSTGNGYHVQSGVTNHSINAVRTWGHASDDPFKVQGTGNYVRGCYERSARVTETALA